MEAEFYIEQFNYITSRLSGRGKQAVALQILHELAKDRRMAEFVKRGNGNGNLASAKQIAYAHALGLELPEDITKKEATKLISEYLQGKELSKAGRVK